MTQEEKTKLEESIVDVLKTVYDPEIPVNIYDLGMIYKIDLHDDGTLDMDMTFTSPSCPAADYIFEDVRTKVEGVKGVETANINLVFDPIWDQSMMSEEARVELGFDYEECLFPFRCPSWLIGSRTSANARAPIGSLLGQYKA